MSAVVYRRRGLLYCRLLLLHVGFGLMMGQRLGMYVVDRDLIWEAVSGCEVVVERVCDTPMYRRGFGGEKIVCSRLCAWYRKVGYGGSPGLYYFMMPWMSELDASMYDEPV